MFSWQSIKGIQEDIFSPSNDSFIVAKDEQRQQGSLEALFSFQGPENVYLYSKQTNKQTNKQTSVLFEYLSICFSLLPGSTPALPRFFWGKCSGVVETSSSSPMKN